MKRLICCILLAVLIFSGCSQRKTTSGSMIADNIFPYEKFIFRVNDMKKNFKPANFINASSEGPLVKQIFVFPEDIQLDVRNNDGINGDPGKPSKYILYYLTKDKSVFIKMNLIYAQNTNVGIVLQSIVSPVDNVGLDKEYHSIHRPFAINKMLSRKGYLIHLEYYLIDPDKDSGNHDKKIQKLIDIDREFCRKLEKYLLEVETAEK